MGAPDSFAAPLAEVGRGLHYYAVDHSPSYLWDSATWENSEALLEYLPVVMAGPDSWDAQETIRRGSRSATASSRTRASSPSRAGGRLPARGQIDGVIDYTPASVIRMTPARFGVLFGNRHP